MLMSTVRIASHKTIITKSGRASISSRSRTEVSRATGRNGSIMRKTERGLLTGIRPRPRSLTGVGRQKLQGRERLSADGLTREDRTCPGEQAASEAALRAEPGLQQEKQEGRTYQGEEAAIAEEHSAALTAAAVQETSAAVGNQVVRACLVAAVVAVDAAAADSAVVVAVDAAVVAVDAVVVAVVEGGRHVKISANNKYTYEGGRNETSEGAY